MLMVVMTTSVVVMVMAVVMTGCFWLRLYSSARVVGIAQRPGSRAGGSAIFHVAAVAQAAAMAQVNEGGGKNGDQNDDDEYFHKGFR